MPFYWLLKNDQQLLIIDRCSYTDTCIYFYYRGISSTVRRCIEKETGKEYAAKIIDLSSVDGANDGSNVEATRQEINILRHVVGHPFISKK